MAATPTAFEIDSVIAKIQETRVVKRAVCDFIYVVMPVLVVLSYRILRRDFAKEPAGVAMTARSESAGRQCRR